MYAYLQQNMTSDNFNKIQIMLAQALCISDVNSKTSSLVVQSKPEFHASEKEGSSEDEGYA